MPSQKKITEMSSVYIRYQPGLIAELHDEHEDLLQQMEFMQQLVEKQEIKLLPLALELFRGEVLEHVSKEILKLYVYLRNSLKDQPEKHQQMKQLRKAMDTLLNIILEFLDQHSDADIEHLYNNPEEQEKFLIDTQKIIDLFGQRIQVEETVLFPMYQP